MTLNITVLTKRAIYQCADFRFVNNQTKQASDLQEQMKVQACAGSGWSASVCFNGVGTTSTGLSVSEWLIEKLNTLRPFESEFEELVALLRSADDWLGNEPPPYNRHTFTIGAFIQGRPLFGLVSNYEKLSGAIASIAYSVLDYEFTWVKGSRSIASGSGKVALTRETLNRLTNLGSVHQAPDPVFTALAAANEGVAAVLGPGGSVSRACFTTYLSRTGEGASKPHNIAVSRLNFPAFPGNAFEPEIKRLLEAQFPSGWSLVGTSSARLEPTDEYHALQLKDKPNDPNSHNNYGAYLLDRKKDSAGAKAAYLRALELDPKHTNAHGNLGNLLMAEPDEERAVRHYEQGLSSSPGDENITWNYASFLTRKGEKARALELVSIANDKHPQSGRLLLLRAQLELARRNLGRAREYSDSAYQNGADQSLLLPLQAFLTEMEGQEVAACIAAYRTAIAVSPENYALKLNLSQLLLAIDDRSESRRLLAAAEIDSKDLAAQLEGAFYWLVHAGDDPATYDTVIRLYEQGARLTWDVRHAIGFAQRNFPDHAALLAELREALAADGSLVKLRAMRDKAKKDRKP